MHARLLFTGLATAVLAATAVAQTAIWTPIGAATVVGNTSSQYPWATGYVPVHYLQIYSATNFTGQSVSSPMLISRLRFRANVTTNAWPGGTWPSVVVVTSTAAMPYGSISTTFASNHGFNLTTVYSGPVTALPGPSSPPGLAFIDIPLSTPFIYDPSAGDLCLEIHQYGSLGPSNASTGCQAVQGSSALARRLYYYSHGDAPTGTTDGSDYGLVTEFTYQPIGPAYAVGYGNGCSPPASFYQTFRGGMHPLSNHAIRMLPTGTGYAVTAASSSWWTPVGANLGLTNDAVSGPHPLGFTFNYPGGSTASVYISSNGFVWLQPQIANGCCFGAPASLLSMGPRICPLWTNLDPSTSGTVVFDVDVPNQTAYVTWTNVPEFGTVNLNTFQVAFHSSGQIDMRWQVCTVWNSDALSGWSPGIAARDPGNTSILGSLPLFTGPDLPPLALATSAPPRIGTTINLVTSNIPAGTPAGAGIFSATQHIPGIDLASMGMPGCRQYVGLDATGFFAVSGSSASLPMSVPNNPALAGLLVRAQSATFSPNVNPLGVIVSNGLTLMLDLH